MKTQTFKVVIVYGCAWYKNHIGKTFEVTTNHMGTHYFRIDNDYAICIADCKIIK